MLCQPSHFTLLSLRYYYVTITISLRLSNNFLITYDIPIVASTSGCIFTVFYFSPSATAQLLRCCATNRKVCGSIPDGVTGIFH